MSEIVRTRTVGFTADRMPMPRKIRLGMEGDNLVERLRFALPVIAEHQTATLVITGRADAATLKQDEENGYYIDLTRAIVGPDGETEAYVVIDGADGESWRSDVMRLITGALPDVDEEIQQRYPGAVETMLGKIAEHNAEMEQQTERVEDAAKRAEDAAQRAEAGGGGGAGEPGKDGGYYQPSVTDGVLSWTPSKADMPAVPDSDVRGPAGNDGKTAYQYAQDGGYMGTEAEFAAKMAKEIPDPYTLPVATADRLGGVKIGDGLMVGEDGRVGVRPEGKYELIEKIAIGYKLISEKPHDWETNYGAYYEIISESVVALTSKKDWKPYAFYEVDNAGGINGFSRSVEPDGTKYKFNHLYVRAIIPLFEGNYAAYTMVNNVRCMYFSKVGDSSSISIVQHVIDVKNGLLTARGRAHSYSEHSQGGYSTGAYMGGFAMLDVSSIYNFNFYMVNGCLPVGAIIEIYGVRA